MLSKSGRCRRMGIFLALGTLGCGAAAPDPIVPSLVAPAASAPLALEVDPFIGTANEGHTFPGATRPWGMASPSPHTTRVPFESFLEGGMQANAGYVHGQPELQGFGLTHVSGNGCPDHGAPVIAASLGAPPTSPEAYRSGYDSEQARAGYYATRLARFDIWAEMTATPRAGALRFFFPASEQATIVVDTAKTLSWVEDRGAVRIVGPREIEGSVTLGHSCAAGNESRLHFVLRVDRNAIASGTLEGGSVSDASEATGDAMAFLRFRTEAGDSIEVRVGLSWVSIEGARANLEAETDGKSFAELHDEAALDWQRRLSRVEVEGGAADDRQRFYTALYHSLLHPNLASDVDGSFIRFVGNEVGSVAGEARYTLFSLWDTYRTLHPLLTLLYPQTQLSMLRTLADMADSAGAPPLWEISGDEVQMMMGDPVPIVAADSFAKGLTDFDAEGLYQTLKRAAERPSHRPGITEHRSLGFIPMELRQDLWGPASTTLEYSLADHAMARLAAALGHEADAARYDAASLAYRNLFDVSTHTLRPKNADGSFFDPFDPDAERASWRPNRLGGPGYVEGTAWQYAFMVPHDIPGLIALHGETEFIDLLQWVFDTDRFALWNEPDITYPYLFTYVDGEWARTQQEVRDAREAHFGTGPAGLPGNDDAGTLSAWFVFAALGFQPVAVGTDEYRLGVPLFDRVILHLDPTHHSGGRFVIERASGALSPQASLDGALLGSPAITHREITAGGTLRFQ
ncbi:MAG: GH92 family glycosyl hydrolase [Deltaproteobacteria bacterium]|nr:GH92 family glycosyl hydrolase [Deltaproteobacteria bacterium]